MLLALPFVICFCSAEETEETKEEHVNDHTDPVPGCKKNNYDFCLNGGTCAIGGICTCKKEYTGIRCEQNICDRSKALSTKTGQCIDVDQFIMNGTLFF